VKKILVAIAALVALGACTDADNARRALSTAGYSDIRIEGYAWFGCSEDDTFATRFKAKGPSGVEASGQVCSGWLKGSTIRLD